MNRRAALIAVFVGGLVVAACGGSGDATSDEPAGATTDAPSSDPGDEPAGEPADEPADSGASRPEPVLTGDTPTELVITDLTVGSGRPAEVGDTVVVDYVGVLSADGTEFDNSYDRGSPIEIVIGTTGLIEGFTTGLIGVQQGTVRQLDIPAELAYGDVGAGDVIPPGAAITFVLEVRSVEARAPRPTLAPEIDTASCPPAGGTSEQQQQFDEYPPTCIDVTRTYTAEIVTNFGDITVELDPTTAPLAVNSFVTLARHRYFDGTQCHRAIPGFVVQCGDPTATGSGGPGYRFADELPGAGAYEIGSVAMANAGPDTNGSQFFIITGPDGAALPPQYTLFGTVVAGLDTTVAELDAVANPTNNGVPPLAEIVIESVTVTES
jgi:cyclophilin family peptidyl-prolyl cis-trans isomerase